MRLRQRRDGEIRPAFFTYKPPCESDRRSGDLFSCHRQPPFLSLRFLLYCNDSLLYRYSFAVGSLPVGTRFFRCKGIALEAHPSTADVI